MRIVSPSCPPALPALLSAALLAVTSAAWAEEVSVGKIPAKVIKAADTAVPNAKWASASKDLYEKEVWYTLEGTDAKGRDVSVEVSETGELGEVGTEIELADAPAAVRKAIKDKLAGFKETSVTEVRSEGQVVRCDLEGTDKKGRFVTTDISASGEVGEVFTEVGTADVPKAVKDAVKGKYPRFKPTTNYEVREGGFDGAVVRYDIEGRRPVDKEDITLSVTPDGKSVTIDE